MAVNTQMQKSPLDAIGMSRSPRQDRGSSGAGAFSDQDRPGFADVLADVSRDKQTVKRQEQLRETKRQEARKQQASDDDQSKSVEPDRNSPQSTREQAAVDRGRNDKDEVETAEPEDDAAEELAASAAGAQVIEPLTAELTDESDEGEGGDVEAVDLKFSDTARPRAESARLPAAAAPAPAAPTAATTADMPGMQLSGADSGADSALDLLSSQELASQDIQLETEGGEMMERLQQALATNHTEDLEELGKPVVPQVVRSLAALARNGVSEMRVQLQPGDLGEIELRVRAVEGMIRSEIMVQHVEVKNLLDSQIERLREALEAQGLQLEGFDVGVSDDGAFARDRDADTAGGSFAGLLEGDEATPTDEQPPVSAVPRRPVQLTEDAVDWLV